MSESLPIGDRVVTTRGEKPIKWIGRQHFGGGRSARWPDSVHPIRVSRSALADNVPHTDLYLSPMHALLIDDVLIGAKDHVNGASITRAVPEGMRDIEYFHIELETHEVILAEGAPVETLLLTEGRESFSNFVEYERLYGCGLASRRSSTFVNLSKSPTTASRHGRLAWSCDVSQRRDLWTAYL